jgi:single-stranded-DNA-specific exonuclease
VSAVPVQIRARPVPVAWQRLAAVVPAPVAKVLAARGLSSPEELDLRLAGLRGPDDLPGLAPAIERLVRAIHDNEPILVVGDFDADGATGTAVAVRGLRMLGARSVDFAVPDRMRHGYGLSVGLVEELLARRPALIVTVDQGTSSVAGVERAVAAGVDVLVTDHHLPGDGLPPAVAIVNPNLVSHHPLAALSGVGVMFLLLAALRSALVANGLLTARPPLADLLDLVAAGTVADLVPLDRGNRILVAEGLRRIRAGRMTAGVAALIRSAGRDPARMDARDLGFQLGPRINAAGRLDDMTLGIRCLLSDDPDEASELAAVLSGLNHERRALQAGMEEQARTIVERVLAGRGGALPDGVVVADPDWHPGVVGLVAGRLAERLNRPTIALAPVEGQSEWRGSARSVPGFHLRDALVELDRRQPGLMSRYGGHAAAAGLSLAGERVDALGPAFEAVAADLLAEEQKTRLVWTDGELAPADFGIELARTLGASGPYGQAFPEPLFDGEFEVLDRRVLKEKHLKLTVRSRGSAPQKALWFGAPEEMLADTPTRLRLLYQLSVEEWQGIESLNLIVRMGFAG